MSIEKEARELSKELVQAIDWSAAEYKYLKELQEELKEVEKGEQPLKKLRKAVKIVHYICKAERRADYFEKSSGKKIEELEKELSAHLGEEIALNDLINGLKDIAKEIGIGEYYLVNYASYYDSVLEQELDKAVALAKLEEGAWYWRVKKEKEAHIAVLQLVKQIEAQVEDAEKWIAALEESLKKAQDIVKKILETTGNLEEAAAKVARLKIVDVKNTVLREHITTLAGVEKVLTGEVEGIDTTQKEIHQDFREASFPAGMVREAGSFISPKWVITFGQEKTPFNINIAFKLQEFILACNNFYPELFRQKLGWSEKIQLQIIGSVEYDYLKDHLIIERKPAREQDVNTLRILKQASLMLINNSDIFSFEINRMIEEINNVKKHYERYERYEISLDRLLEVLKLPLFYSPSTTSKYKSVLADVRSQLNEAELNLKKLQEEYGAFTKKFKLEISPGVYLGPSIMHQYEKGFFGLCFLLPSDYKERRIGQPGTPSCVGYPLLHLCGLFLFPYRKTNFLTLKKTMFHCFGNNLHQYVPIYTEKGKVLWPD